MFYNLSMESKESKKKIAPIIDADEQQKKIFANLQKRNKQAPIDIVCD